MTDGIKALEEAMAAQRRTEEHDEYVPGQWAINRSMFCQDFPAADIAYIAACHPDTIRALLADAKRWRYARQFEVVIDTSQRVPEVRSFTLEQDIDAAMESK